MLEGVRILVVDDDPDARELLRTVLSQRAANVVDAESAEEALQLLVRDRPDVLISDIAMPEQDGYMLIGRVRALAEDAGGRTPAVAVTAYAGTADRTRALGAGFDAHFAKPIDIDVLVGAIVDMATASRARG